MVVSDLVCIADQSLVKLYDVRVLGANSFPVPSQQMTMFFAILNAPYQRKSRKARDRDPEAHFFSFSVAICFCRFTSRTMSRALFHMPEPPLAIAPNTP